MSVAERTKGLTVDGWADTMKRRSQTLFLRIANDWSLTLSKNYF